ncbi:hypothetical protein WJX81_004063 [Elliptochloris bilobata]|uniref:Vps72/YL1 C-terminal domain-containing protein n=1 Tax=Elliptochloris bilobata TaxID=381761 RepID=A0AAW1SA29_9CHLO
MSLSEPQSSGEREDGEENEEDNEEDSEGDTGEEEEGEEDESDAPESPKFELPDRATRGNRLGQLMEDQDGADVEFWSQDFFAEERADEQYATESESEDEADTDFSGSEEDDEEGGDDGEAKDRRKTLKPPGAGKPPRPPRHSAAAAAAAADAGAKGLSPAEAAAAKAAAHAAKRVERQMRMEEAAAMAPTLRKSTRERIEEAERERQLMQQRKPRKRRVEAEVRALTQEELLAEAAETELVNTASLARLIAVEEEVKARAAINKKSGYSGPLLRYHSRRVGEGAGLRCETVFEVVNMLPPPELQAQRAPPPVSRATCAVTGLLARFRDPVTGAAYATAAAFRTLRQRAADTRPAQAPHGKRRRTASGALLHEHDAPWQQQAQAAAVPPVDCFCLALID